MVDTNMVRIAVAGPEPDHQILRPLCNLKKNLQNMPGNVIEFSLAMRVLYNQSAVSGEHSDASSFLQLRDKTRKNALIYINTLLPQTDDVVRKIKRYGFEIRISQFEDWHEGLDEIIQEVTKAEEECKFLMHMHENLIVELKRNEDEAKVAITDLDKLSKKYEADKEELLSNAKQHLMNKEWYDKLGLTLMIPTLGIGTLVAHAKGKKELLQMDKNLYKATASEQNGEIVQEAVNLTEKCLIPAIGSFLTGLKACSVFLTSTREQLSDLSERGQEFQEAATKRYFRLMKGHAEELENNCEMFITSSTDIRTNLKAIPSEPSDKNYVDKWLTEQLANFKSSNPYRFGSILNLFQLGFITDEIEVLEISEPTVGLDALANEHALKKGRSSSLF